ncbi:MAG: ornithine cyclodeaminase family protein [Aigarchaeota archaeon]|nr:ornithine cyclodeaminase family protein [Aigarchaeota archaeon]MDW8092164.1 ornithine cyclodeaminase family protein [Nitrososphaerota archaeon]
MRHITASEIDELISMKIIVEVVEEVLKELSRRESVMPVRTRLTSGSTDVLIMPAYSSHFDLSTVKVVTVNNDNPKRGLPTIQGSIIAVRPETGEVLATLDAGIVTAYRTGAASAVATKYLSRGDSMIVAVIGTGVQARYQLLGVLTVRDVERVRVYSRTRERVERFVKEVMDRHSIDVKACKSAEEAVRGADIVITATNSPTPVVRREWLSDGTHINAIGSYKPNERELSTETITSSSVYVDHLDSAKEEAGDLIIPISEGLFSWDMVRGEIGEVAMGLKPGRTSDEELTVFKSVGVAVEDTAAVAAILRRTGLL